MNILICRDEDTPLSEGASAELECLRMAAAAALLSSAEMIGDPESPWCRLWLR
jgi:hypothetical protein